MTIKRREFLLYSGATGLIAAGIGNSTCQAANLTHDLFELRKYTLESHARQEEFETFMAQAAIPALNRLKINTVGVFYPSDNTPAAYVLLRHQSAETLLTATQRLAEDQAFLLAGSRFLNAPADSPAFKRCESSLMTAIDGMPRLEQPVSATNTDRVFQLRIYESPSVATGLKKIEMFNKGELDIFRKTGLNPVFFGQTLIGPAMPNLTYMLAFDSSEHQKKAWDTLRTHPDWLTLRAIPEYADKRILSGITNIPLRPAPCSQL